MRPILALALCAPAWATAAPSSDEALQLSGTERIRYEAASGLPRQSFRDADQWISLRTTLAARYEAGPVHFVGELYDSRVYLDDQRSAVSTNDVNALELVQAYVATKAALPFGGESAAAVQAGRFTMNVGSRRLIGADDFRNTINSVTGIKADFDLPDHWSGNVYYTYPQTRLPDDLTSLLQNSVRLDRESSANVLYGATLLTPRLVAGGALETMYVQFHERDSPGRPTRDRNLQTVDLRWFRDPGAAQWDWEFEGALQTGHASTTSAATAPVKEVAANFLHLRVGYQWEGAWKARLAFEFDRASGEGNGVKSQRFDTLFGMRRSDFAPPGLYSLIGRANLVSPGLRFEAAPTPRVELMATLRGLWLASPRDSFSTISIRDPKGNAGDFAGTQVDSRVRYWIVPQHLRFEFDGVVLAKGRFLEVAPGTRNDGDTRYLAVALQAYF